MEKGLQWFDINTADGACRCVSFVLFSYNKIKPELQLELYGEYLATFALHLIAYFYLFYLK